MSDNNYIDINRDKICERTDEIFNLEDNIIKSVMISKPIESSIINNEIISEITTNSILLNEANVRNYSENNNLNTLSDSVNKPIVNDKINEKSVNQCTDQEHNLNTKGSRSNKNELLLYLPSIVFSFGGALLAYFIYRRYKLS